MHIHTYTYIYIYISTYIYPRVMKGGILHSDLQLYVRIFQPAMFDDWSVFLTTCPPPSLDHRSFSHRC